MLDLVIIGGAAVGCSAAIYAARRKLNFRLITENIGGEVALSGETNNWPGIISIDGFDLAQKFAEHAKSYDVNIEEGWRVTDIVPTKNYHVVRAEKSNGEAVALETKTVIIGTGIHPKRLGVPGEDKLDRKGVTYCTVCDGPLYKKKITATIGAGNSALESALMMGSLAEKEYLLTKFKNTPEFQGGFPKGDAILIEKVKALNNIEIIYEADTTEIVGDTKVEALKYKTAAGENKTIVVQGVMVHIGMIPNSQFASKLKKNSLGEIVTDQLCHTSVPGIFAAGDVTNIPHKQIAIAAGTGVVAALEAIGYVNTWKP
ncbi:MAG: FAD-dependent oxidoreductase [Candidatus Magasanikbacteria bacterium]|nr:FAD-dependent oxidoreductase [Candidatus Magasanikbacteria bacterium]